MVRRKRHTCTGKGVLQQQQQRSKCFGLIRLKIKQSNPDFLTKKVPLGLAKWLNISITTFDGSVVACCPLVLTFCFVRREGEERFDSIQFVSFRFVSFSVLIVSRASSVDLPLGTQKSVVRKIESVPRNASLPTNIVSHVHSGDRRRWLQILRSPDGDCGVSFDAGLGAHLLLWLWLCCAVLWNCC